MLLGDSRRFGILGMFADGGRGGGGGTKALGSIRLFLVLHDEGSEL